MVPDHLPFKSTGILALNIPLIFNDIVEFISASPERTTLLEEVTKSPITPVSGLMERLMALSGAIASTTRETGTRDSLPAASIATITRL